MPPDLILLLAATFLAGVLNAAAGGGTFLTLPALMLAGVPPVAANATGTVALLPGYLSSVAGFREELREGRAVLVPVVAASVAGGMLGASLLIVTPDEAFRRIVPWLMLVATLWFALWPLFERHFLERRLRRRARAGRRAIAAGVLPVAVYGGYFNGGLGIVLLAALSSLGFRNLNAMNALKNVSSAILTVVAVAVYALGHQVVWHYVAWMAGASVVGGYAGARQARRLPEPALRAGIVAIGLLMTVGFFWF